MPPLSPSTAPTSTRESHTITASPGTATTRTSFTVRTSSLRPSSSLSADTPASPSSRSAASSTPRSTKSGTPSPDLRPDQGSADYLVVRRPCSLLHPRTAGRGREGESRSCYHMGRRHSWFYIRRYRPRGLPRDPCPPAEERSQGCYCGMARGGPAAKALGRGELGIASQITVN
ncbi:hypothetical protein IEO21_06931 [Rhodonia placenta]|uniref:Uncharacterized protein n=1 Tax=Rhodonia placenta TaxID=104341 RepID=A0A8H7NZH6_9APHY|nr:hypothetical protein IEO21_06931 [Postia placenta]